MFDQNVINLNKLPNYIIPMDFYSGHIEIRLFLIIQYKEKSILIFKLAFQNHRYFIWKIMMLMNWLFVLPKRTYS